jgi:hypothetical protein
VAARLDAGVYHASEPLTSKLAAESATDANSPSTAAAAALVAAEDGAAQRMAVDVRRVCMAWRAATQKPGGGFAADLPNNGAFSGIGPLAWDPTVLIPVSDFVCSALPQSHRISAAACGLVARTVPVVRMLMHTGDGGTGRALALRPLLSGPPQPLHPSQHLSSHRFPCPEEGAERSITGLASLSSVET